MSLFNSLTDNDTAYSFENMDVNSDYNCDFMTSDFFDTILSLENDSSNALNQLENKDLPQEFNIDSSASTHSDESFAPYVNTSEEEGCNVPGEPPEKRVKDDAVFGTIDESLLLSLLQPVQNSAVEKKKLLKVEKQVMPRKIMLRGPTNRVISKPIMYSYKRKPGDGTQTLRVQHIDENGRQIILPLKVESIRVLDPAEIKQEEFQIVSSPSSIDSSQNRPDSTFSDSTEPEDEREIPAAPSKYPPLSLTLEEKRLLEKEGIHLPTHYPLTKHEERELKRIRRKIRNKISAQDSRKRKKEYVDSLEERIRRNSEEKKALLQRIKQLQRRNNQLMSHFGKLQALMSKSLTSKATPSTCLMIVLLSAFLVSLPSMHIPKDQLQEAEQGTNRRALLSSETDENYLLDEFLVFKDELGLNTDNLTEKELAQILDVNNKIWAEKEGLYDHLKENFDQWVNGDTKTTYAEPDIDDEPPFKQPYYDESADSKPNMTLDPPGSPVTVKNTKDQ